MVQLSATWKEALHQHCNPLIVIFVVIIVTISICSGIIIIYLVVMVIIAIVAIFTPCSVVGWWASEFGLPLSPMDNRPCHALRPLPAPPLKVSLQSSNEDFHVFQCGYILIFSIWRICISLLCFHAPLSALSSSFCCRVIHAPRSTLSYLHHFIKIMKTDWFKRSPDIWLNLWAGPAGSTCSTLPIGFDFLREFFSQPSILWVNFV